MRKTIRQFATIAPLGEPGRVGPDSNGKARHAHPKRHALTRRYGFTLVEMLVVISIVVILTAIVVPMLGVMSDLLRGGAGVNTINAAVTAARGYSTRDVQYVLGTTGDYSGVAVLFCPSGELRLIENAEVISRESDGVLLEDVGLNGYRDIPNRDYLTLPNDTGVVGIARTSSGSSGIELYSPPFAVRFDEDGHLIAGLTAKRLVYYDGRLPSGVDTSSSRTSTYDADKWDARSDEFDASLAGPDATTSSYYLPFDQIETVPGVIVYSRSQLKGDTDPTSGDIVNGCGPDRTDPCDAGTPAENFKDWLDNNGQPLFFSRYTGVVLREESQ